MKFSIVAASAALVAGAAAWGGNSTGPVYVTEVVTAYTTYCPAATEIEHGGTTYTVTASTTLVLPCPGGCTITKPVSTAVVTDCSTTSVPVVQTSKNVPTGGVSSALSSGPYNNGTVPTKSLSPPPTGGVTTTGGVATFTGAANKAIAASGAGLAGLLGLVAYAL